MEMAMLLKPGPLLVKKKGDPEQLAKDWDDYIKVFQVFLGATGVAGVHVNPEIADSPCAACLKANNLNGFLNVNLGCLSVPRNSHGSVANVQVNIQTSSVILCIGLSDFWLA